MNSSLKICTSLILVALNAVPWTIATGQEPSCVEEKTAMAELWSLLENGQSSGSLPQGMVVRVRACLGAAKTNTSEESVPKDLHENWEFTSNEIHRILFEETEEGDSERRESRPFDSKKLCRILLEGKAIDIQARKGVGPESAFLGTIYQLGSRSIEVVWKDKTILDLHEYNSVGEVLYRESDARAFATLYERLVSQAQEPFNSNQRDVK